MVSFLHPSSNDAFCRQTEAGIAGTLSGFTKAVSIGIHIRDPYPYPLEIFTLVVIVNYPHLPYN